MPPTRRQVLITGATALLGTACGGASSPGGRVQPVMEAADPLPENRSQVFPHGVASGDPLNDRAILWTRLTVPEGLASASGSLRVWSDAELTELVNQQNFTTSQARDWTVKIDQTGLLPGQAYYFQFSALGDSSPVGRVRTIPTDPQRARFAVLTCGDYSRGLWNAYARVAQRADLDAVIHLGDYIYETDRDRVRAHQPPVDIVSLDEYRARYASYRVELPLQEMHRQHPVIWVWDDHETVNGSWMNGADDHDPATQGDYAVRKANALQAALEWLPIRSPEPQTNPERIYRQFVWGNLLDLIMLDTRRIGRDQQGVGTIGDDFFRQGDAPFNDPARHILGQAQEDWLANSLAASQQRGARWRLLGNQVVFSQIKVVGAPDNAGAVYANPDQWDGYKPARERVFDAIEASAIDNLVFLTGDVHASMVYEASRDPHGGSYVPGTGVGSFATEFVVPSISSAGDPAGNPTEPDEDTVLTLGADALRASNPHLRYIEAQRNGYCIADIDQQRVQIEYWLVPTVLTETNAQTNEINFVVNPGTAAVMQSQTGASNDRAETPEPAPAASV